MIALTPHPFRKSVSALAVASLLFTSACVTTQADRIGADDGMDTCRVYRVALDSTGNHFEEDLVKGALLGAAGGAITGLLAGGDARSALIGAAGGAALGAAAGYWQHKQQQAQDQAILYRSVLSDVNSENQQIAATQNAFNQLVGCRRNQASMVRADLKTKRIDRPTAEARMQQIKARYEEDVRIAQAINANIAKRAENFEFANEQVNPNSQKKLNSMVASVSKTGNVKAGQVKTTKDEVMASVATNIARRNQLNKSVETAAADSKSFELG